VDPTEIKDRGTFSLSVRKEIVGHLSTGIYRNFALAIRELISNAYDADATEAKLKLDFDNKTIIVRDNGGGMDRDEINNKFLAIGATNLKSDISKLGRKRIGTFGIGFLSVFPYCESLQIYTKKAGSDEIIEFNIDTEQFFIGDSFEIKSLNVPIPFTAYDSDIPHDVGETIIILKNIKQHIIKDLENRHIGTGNIDKLGGYEKFKWTICQYAPIQFPKERQDLREFFNDTDRIPMRLWLDGEELFRNVPDNTKVLEKDEKKIGNVLFKYAILTPSAPVKPLEAKGLQIRLRDVAIGLPTDFDITKLANKVLGKFNYLCGEVHILEGLDSALMISRDSFSYTQDVADIYEFFRKTLHKWNDVLEDWSREDKKIYEVLPQKTPDSIIKELKKADIIHYSKERLRLPKSLNTTKKGIKTTPSKQIKEALANKEDYKVISENKAVTQNEPPIKFLPEKKTIIVYDKHPAFNEEIGFNNDTFLVGYEEWDYEKTPYSICKIDYNLKKATFNSKHPLLKNSLYEGEVKKLSLGILLILKDQEERDEILSKFNKLLEETFSGG
jgi:hypothetical protein